MVLTAEVVGGGVVLLVVVLVLLIYDASFSCGSFFLLMRSICMMYCIILHYDRLLYVSTDVQTDTVE